MTVAGFCRDRAVIVRQGWPHLVEVYGPYEGYQQKTTREIPVVRLRRV